MMQELAIAGCAVPRCKRHYGAGIEVVLLLYELLFSRNSVVAQNKFANEKLAFLKTT